MGELPHRRCESAVPGGVINYAVHLPPAYDEGVERYPTAYLLHGRGDGMLDWQGVLGDLDELIEAGLVPPLIVVMPDAPWSNRAGYYVDSLYSGPTAAAIETAFTADLIADIDRAFRTRAEREWRMVGGYSMGGAGALRFLTAHQRLFASALVLSPAAYRPLPPLGSSAREFGAYGSGAALFDPQRYEALNYPATVAAMRAELPVELFIAAGDNEYEYPDEVDAAHNAARSAEALHAELSKHPAVTAELRLYRGGHDWDVWRPAFRDGLQALLGAPRLPLG